MIIYEKIRQNDYSGQVSIEEFGGNDALVLSSVYNDEEYCTYIYSYAGQLKELFTKKNITLSPEAGRNILAISEFTVTETDDGLFEITLVDDEHRSETILIASKAD